jgi:hypothetical protein
MALLQCDSSRYLSIPLFRRTIRSKGYAKRRAKRADPSLLLISLIVDGSKTESPGRGAAPLRPIAQAFNASCHKWDRANAGKRKESLSKQVPAPEKQCANQGSIGRPRRVQ